MISYHLVARKSPKDKSVKYYASIDKQHPANRADLLERLEKRSTLSSADVKACLDALEYEIKEVLLEGHSIRFGDLGSFHLSVSSTGVEAADKSKFTAANIKRVRVHFTPSAVLSRDMQPATAKGKAHFILNAPAESGD